jgi:hypothetical protein
MYDNTNFAAHKPSASSGLVLVPVEGRLNFVDCKEVLVSRPETRVPRFLKPPHLRGVMEIRQRHPPIEIEPLLCVLHKTMLACAPNCS